MPENDARWIWYPGDLELYYAMKQNFSRVERGCAWPAFWKSEGFRQRVAYRRQYSLKSRTHFTVWGAPDTVGYVDVDGEKTPFGQPVTCPKGSHRVSVHAASISCVPAIYVAGPVICSDAGWMAEDYAAPPVPAAQNDYFTRPGQKINEWPMKEEPYRPVKSEDVDGGALYEFETELTAQVEVLLPKGREMPVVYLAESREEALDTANCYYFCRPDKATNRTPRQAVRYVFLPGFKPGEARVTAYHQYVDIKARAEFLSDDDLLNRIFAVSAHTFLLCCDVFFLDGIKRDKWIWGGDAYQSLFVNRYLTGDKAIEQRTLTALRGNDPVNTHVNTIVDYSLLWIISMAEHTDAYGDEKYLKMMWPKMKSMMDFLLAQRDGEGFLVGREKDWLFIDWADFDRDGPLCAEQMLLAAALGVMARLAEGDDARMYREMSENLTESINRRFWDEEKSAYVDSFTSGRRHVTKHANILAILFGLADKERCRTLARSVLLNPEVPAITTPYFRFFELDALCRLGYLKEVLAQIKAYWGGMLQRGAVTFWEAFDPDEDPQRQYAMYGDPFGKSLCHAWSASPIYLILKYFVGFRVDPHAPEGYTLKPAPGFFKALDCAVPAGDALVKIRIRGNKVTAEVIR